VFDPWDRSAGDALDAFIAEKLAAVGVVAPPVDALAAARTLGLVVAQDGLQTGRARIARLKVPSSRGPQAVVFLNKEPREERRHWAVAHEIGEHFAAELFARLGIDPRELAAGRERMANQFARRFLLPADWFSQHGGESGWDLMALKGIFATASHELIAQRMLDMPPTVVITVFDHGRVTWRRTNLASRAPRICRDEAECQRLVHAENRPARRRTAEYVVRAWPVHEPDWKREIVRTELLCVF
jgi:Zn-dependent peptidase ImmA (M78 family)